ncbi:GNAT family N-acetyltransferase [Motilimonas pumila]|uniref:GNAT family N-acetyltransferase n=1 Tax=Motilimonas pumila TaxID=2303987 RepID=A0A418YK20_9GAMM|nr:GNAT family N-acetyltransferase [Motilimonas pumila]RJG51328.1 GNAT family N-acetyltransferase [Motilimonas pumila]
MDFSFRLATSEDAAVIAKLVCQLTTEIGERAQIDHFDNDIKATCECCEQLLSQGQLNVLLAETDGVVVAMASYATTFALYVKGEMGIIQELYVEPTYRSQQLGQQLLVKIEQIADVQGWRAIELCTPPLPAFDNTLAFYQRHHYQAVGGRKMRKMVANN